MFMPKNIVALKRRLNYIIKKNKLGENRIKNLKKMAGVEGLEPSQAVLETDVLPLTLYPYETFIILAYWSKKINTKIKLFKMYVIRLTEVL